MGELLVRGHAEAWLRPDGAALDVTVTAVDPQTQQGALDRLGALCAEVDRIIDLRRDGTDGLVRRAVVSSVTTAEDVEHGPGGQRHRVGFRATRATSLGCAADADGLTGLVAALARDGVALRGPRWQVGGDDPAWIGVRSAAVADARSRAEAYALAVDGRVGAVRWIAEPGLRGGSDPSQPLAGARLAAVEHHADGARAVRIAVEPVQVSVDVEVAFDLGP